MKHPLNPLVHALSAVLVLTLTACGGGSSSGSAAADPLTAVSPTVTLTGAVMVDQAIRNAVVCMDLNANDSCDAGEPVSTKTDADGAYSLSYDTTQVAAAQVAAASLVALMVPGAATDPNTTIDAAEPTIDNTAKPYALKQVPGKSGQINPLTALVAAGVGAGMTEAAARTHAAAQLTVAEAKIDNYQDDLAFSKAETLDNARMMAKVVAATLEGGSTLQVLDQSLAVDAAAGNLANLTFTDASNYFFRTLDVLAKPAGALGATVKDNRVGKTGGVATASSALYNQAFLTPNGWLRCDDTVNIAVTSGNPSRSIFCNALNQVGFTVPTDITSQTMSAVISTLQTDTATNTINTSVSTTALTAALGAAIFPSGSAIRARSNLNLNRPVFINSINTDGRPQSGATTLEQLIAAKPSSAVNLATAAGSLSLGLSSGNLRNLRLAFTGSTSPTAGTVQFYDCDLNSAQTVASNCTTTQTGTYAISTVAPSTACG